MTNIRRNTITNKYEKSKEDLGQDRQCNHYEADSTNSPATFTLALKLRELVEDTVKTTGNQLVIDEAML